MSVNLRASSYDKLDLASIATRSVPADLSGTTVALAQAKRTLSHELSAVKSSRRRVLIVLQGMDGSGKDGVMQELGLCEPATRVARFRAPTPHERARDFLWRVHAQVPCNGEVVVFNRSHYEDLIEPLVAHELTEDAWSRRCEHVNAFERLLVCEGTAVLKFFLHVGRRVQNERLQRRTSEPELRHLFNPDDLARCERWELYARVCGRVLSRTSEPGVPWRIVPADEPLTRNLTVCQGIVETLAGVARCDQG